MNYSVILPTYNEAGNIVPLIEEIRTVLGRCEILVVDDHSPDGTSAVVAAYAKKHTHVHLETRYQSPGLTNSIARGIALASGDVVVWMDCDFSMPPSLIPKLLSKIHEGSDVAVGSRFVPGGKSEDWKIASDLLNTVLRYLFYPSFYDYTSGFIAVKKSVLDAVPLRGDYGEYFIDFIVRAHKKGYRICEVPYIAHTRRSGVSKTGSNVFQFLSRGRKYLSTVLRLWYEN